MDCVRQRIATSENVEPVTRTACVAWRRTPSSAAAATSRPTAPATAPCVATTLAGNLFTNSSTTHCVASWPGLPIAVTLDDLHKGLTTLEDTARIARRVLGGAHPTVADIEISLREARRALRDREALLAKYLLYGASALAIAAFALHSRRR